ncbi:MAG: trigger factor [Planctomycetota bacterium]
MAEETEDTEQTTASTDTEPEKQEDKDIRTEVTWDGECKCEIHADIDAEFLEQRFEDELGQLQEKAQIPGFRVGNAPLGLVKKRYGSKLADDLLGTVLQEAFDDAVEKNDLSVVVTEDGPNPEEMDWEVGEPLECDFTVQVLPQVDIEEEQYKNLEIEVPEQEITDEMIDQELERFAQQMASWEEVEDGGIDVADYVVAQLHVPGDEESQWSDDVEFVPEEKQIGPFQVDGIKGAITGAETGDTVEVEGELLEDHLSEDDHSLSDMVDEPVQLVIEIEEVYRREQPAIDDELAQTMGMDDTEELRNFIADRMEREVKEQEQNVTRQILTNALLEQVDLEMPDALVQQATQDEMRRLMTRALREGQSRDEAEQFARSQAHRSREMAERNLKSTYLLRQIADKERIYVLDDEVQEQIRALAARQDWSVDKAQKYLEKNDMMSSLRSDLRSEKTIQMLLDHAEVNTVPADEFTQREMEEAPAATPEESEDADAAPEEREDAGTETDEEEDKKTQSDDE